MPRLHLPVVSCVLAIGIAGCPSEETNEMVTAPARDAGTMSMNETTGAMLARIVCEREQECSPATPRAVRRSARCSMLVSAVKASSSTRPASQRASPRCRTRTARPWRSTAVVFPSAGWSRSSTRGDATSFRCGSSNGPKRGTIFALQYHARGSANALVSGYTDPKTTIPWYKGTQLDVAPDAVPSLLANNDFGSPDV